MRHPADLQRRAAASAEAHRVAAFESTMLFQNSLPDPRSRGAGRSGLSCAAAHGVAAAFALLVGLVSLPVHAQSGWARDVTAAVQPWNGAQSRLAQASVPPDATKPRPVRRVRVDHSTLPESGLGGLTGDPGRAVVRVSRRGSTLAAGVVLADGRVLTTLSGIGHGHALEVGLGYGTSVPVAVTHTHRGWDLALLTPSEELPPGLLIADRGVQTTRGVAGRAAEIRVHPVAETDQLVHHDVQLVPLAASAVAVVYGVDGFAIESARVPQRAITYLGTPIVDNYGLLTGLVVRACAPEAGDSCGSWQQVVLSGTTIDKFLRQAPTREILPPAWVGLAGEGVDTGVVRGVRVNAVAPDSAAERAHLRVGDVIIAVDERPVTTLLGLALALRGKPSGATLDLLLFRDGSLVPGQIRVSQSQSPIALDPAQGPPKRPASGL